MGFASGALVRATALSEVMTSENPDGVSNVGFLNSSGALAIAALVKTALASSELRLFNAGEIELGPETTVTELDAVECTFSGYTAGGLTITAFNDPLSVGNGAQIVSPLVQFNFVTPADPDPPVTGTVGGWYLVTAAGVLIECAEFSTGVPMTNDASAVPVVVTLQLQSSSP
jgi:hypothetical protein